MHSDDVEVAPPINAHGPAPHSLTGTKQARFVNRYSPAYDKPFERSQLNAGVHLDNDLLELLVEDRRLGVHNHLVADKVFKAYLLEQKSFAGVMRV